MKGEIIWREWPLAEFAFMTADPKNRQCLFCTRPATQCVYHDSPYHYTIANRCCGNVDCMQAAFELTREFIKFDFEANRRGEPG